MAVEPGAPAPRMHRADLCPVCSRFGEGLPLTLIITVRYVLCFFPLEAWVYETGSKNTLGVPDPLKHLFRAMYIHTIWLFVCACGTLGFPGSMLNPERSNRN